MESRRSVRGKGAEALQKIKCAAFGDACVAVNHEVFAQSLWACRVTKQGQRYLRIASNIFIFWYVAR